MLKVITARLHPPQPSSQRLDGLTILLVGASTGIGLEAAKQIAAKGVETLIVTARDAVKAEKTKDTILQHLASLSSQEREQEQHSPNIVPLVLEMISLESIYAFVKWLDTFVSHLDHATLSAGILPGSFRQEATGHKTSIQVNVVSPTLLSLLLMPLLLASSLIQPFFTSAKPLAELSKEENFPQDMMGGQHHYCRSKLMTEYSKRHLEELATLNDDVGKPKVLVVSVCPGAVNSGLSRYSAGSGLMGAVAKVVNTTVARTTLQGSNIYLTSLGLGQEARGEMWTDDHISQDHQQYVQAADGARFGEAVWKELRESLVRTDEEHGQGVVGAMLGSEK